MVDSPAGPCPSPESTSARTYSPRSQTPRPEPYRSVSSLVHCQLQLAHDLAQMAQCVLRAVPSAQDHKVIRISNEASAKALLKAQLLQPQHKPAHVQIRQQW